MKSFKERMKKNLTINTKTEDIYGAGPEKLPPVSSSKTRKPNRASKERIMRKGITKVSDNELCAMYEIRGHLMESCHKGMEVLSARRREGNGVRLQEVVVKTRDKATSFQADWEEREWIETTVTQLNMPKIESMCEYIGVYETPSKYYVVMERAEGMDLFEHLQRGHVSIEDARQILSQMLTALEAMHATGRIHKDLKLENVVVDLQSPRLRRGSSAGSQTSIDAKLIDFDTVQNWEPTSPKAEDVLGTDGYIAPEAYAGEYTPASDVYCIGVIMYRLLTGRFPNRSEIFDSKPGENWVGGPAMKRIQKKLMKEKVDFALTPLNKMPDAQGLVQKLMAFDPKERPSAPEALRHTWFRQEGDDKGGSKSDASTSAGSVSPASVESGKSADVLTDSTTSLPKVALPGEMQGTTGVTSRAPSRHSTNCSNDSTESQRPAVANMMNHVKAMRTALPTLKPGTVVTKKTAKVNLLVVRNPKQWLHGDVDGGTGKPGIISAIDEATEICTVYWYESGQVHDCKIGRTGELCKPHGCIPGFLGGDEGLASEGMAESAVQAMKTLFGRGKKGQQKGQEESWVDSFTRQISG